MVVRLKEDVLTALARTDLEALTPCAQEEADGRLILHAADAIKHAHNTIFIRTLDTDVVVLAVTASQTLSVRIWMQFGTVTSFRFISTHEIDSGLGPGRSLALPMFHALTGCDTVSTFNGRGRVSARNVRELYSHLTDSLNKQGIQNTVITEPVMNSL